ncbi:hypothetical protein SAMN05216525_15831 [Bradyrhizobium sp. Gha]|nr:hypothetical protein SAMN05216525_15831 [Bradyrhizobium sp. Gha]
MDMNGEPAIVEGCSVSSSVQSASEGLKRGRPDWGARPPRKRLLSGCNRREWIESLLLQVMHVRSGTQPLSKTTDRTV